MGFDRRSTPGPGQYDPKKSAAGHATVTGDPSAAFTVTKHGFSADSGQSRDISLRDYATTGPWATYRTARKSDAALAAVSPTSPGPGPDEIPGSVGPQALSTKANAPIVPFGKAERFRRPAAAGDDTPGPGAYDTTKVQGVGKERVVLTEDSPSWSLGKKLESTIYKSMPLDTPGAEYDAHKAKEIGGALSLSHKAVMGKARRAEMTRLNGVPGPGFYKTAGAFGNQMLSHNKNEPKVQFTKKLRTSDMPNGDPVFISRQHGGDRLGRGSPGPSVYKAHLTSTGASYIGGNMTTSYGSKTKTIGFTKGKKLRPASTEGFWNPSNPGPGAYKTTSSMGKQALSKNPSSGSAHKTTTEREAWPKQFLSADHLRVEAQGRDSPGPMYDHPVTAKGDGMIASSKRGAPFGRSTRDATAVRITSPGPAAYTLKREFDNNRPHSAPRKMVGLFAQKGVSFSTEQRPCLQEYDELAPSGNLHLSQSIDQTLLQGYDSPGPGEYLNGTQSAQLLTSFGKTSSIKNCSPTWKIGTGKRPSMGLKRDAEEEPGPGHYTASSSIGKQSYSRSKSAPRTVIPKTTRDKADKVFISRKHSEASGSSDSPGPAAYAENWKISSKKKRSPSFGFGTSQRSNFLYS